jgi:hypothetical protein
LGLSAGNFPGMAFELLPVGKIEIEGTKGSAHSPALFFFRKSRVSPAAKTAKAKQLREAAVSPLFAGSILLSPLFAGSDFFFFCEHPSQAKYLKKADFAATY